MADTRNEDIVQKYFDMVQEEIKKLISEDKEIKPEQVETFNNEIFAQPDEMQSEIRKFIQQASTNNLNIKRIAKTLYDKFKVQVKNNLFNQKDSQNVPNQLMGERKFIKTYEGFMNEYNQQIVKPKWNMTDYESLVNQLEDKSREAQEFLQDMGNSEIENWTDLINLLKDYDTIESKKMAEDIIVLMNMLNHFGIERELELSKLN